MYRGIEHNMVGCKQCGRCCKRTTFWEVCGGEDWKRIYKFLMEKYNGIVDIYVPYRGVVAFDIEGMDTIHKLERENESFYWILDEFDCPFIHHVRDRGRYTGKYCCEFHGTEAKPIGCSKFPFKNDRKRVEKVFGCRYFEETEGVK